MLSLPPSPDERPSAGRDSPVHIHHRPSTTILPLPTRTGAMSGPEHGPNGFKTLSNNSSHTSGHHDDAGLKQLPNFLSKPGLAMNVMNVPTHASTMATTAIATSNTVAYQSLKKGCRQQRKQCQRRSDCARKLLRRGACTLQDRHPRPTRSSTLLPCHSHCPFSGVAPAAHCETRPTHTTHTVDRLSTCRYCQNDNGASCRGFEAFFHADIHP